MLRQPIEARLAGARRVLLAGAGGGYDVVGAVPLLVDLEAAGVEVHLASLSFAPLQALSGRRVLESLVELGPGAATTALYCPEAWLSRWLSARSGRERPVWCFEKTGIAELRTSYEYLTDLLSLDTVMLVDGGIDAVLKGDESCLGTPIEDLTSLAAVNGLKGLSKLLACVGLGAELRDGICHEQVLARIAELTSKDGFLGSVSLLRSTEGGRAYLEALASLHEGQAGLRQSHVQSVVRSAMHGGYGPGGEHVFLTPLLSMYWFFDLEAVASTNLLLPSLVDASGPWDIARIIEGRRASMPVKDRSLLPI